VPPVSPAGGRADAPGVYSGAAGGGPPWPGEADAIAAGAAPRTEEGQRAEARTYGSPRTSNAPVEQSEQKPDSPPRKSRRGLIVGLVIAAVLAVMAAAGVVVTGYFNQSSSFAVGSCVRQDGNRARQASCSDANAFTVVAKVTKQEQCSDANQPYVVIERPGSTPEVLCLRPAGTR
jgi:hypothetical protein